MTETTPPRNRRELDVAALLRLLCELTSQDWNLVRSVADTEWQLMQDRKVVRSFSGLAKANAHLEVMVETISSMKS